MNTVRRIDDDRRNPTMPFFTRSDWIVLIALVALLALTGGEPRSDPSPRAADVREPVVPVRPRGQPLVCGDLWL